MHILFLAVVLFFAVTVSASRFEGPTVIEELPDGPNLIVDPPVLLTAQYPFSSLPAELREKGMIEINPQGNQLVPEIGFARQYDGGVVMIGLDHEVEIQDFMAVSTTQRFRRGEGVCAILNFFQQQYDSYRSLAISFYTSESSNPRVKQNGKMDSIEFSFWGSAKKLRAKYFRKGTSRLPPGRSYVLENNQDRVNLCIVNTGSEVRWYVGGKLAKAVPAKLESPQWVWFTMQDTKNSRCCGKGRSNWSAVNIEAMTAFKLKKPLPIRVVCAERQKCDDKLTKVGIAANKNSGVSVDLYSGSKTYQACKDVPVPPDGYREFCLPKLRPGDKLAAYDKNGNQIVLDWVHTPPSGNYYRFKL
ncbi:hypothetical protein HDU96_004281 [Phlyctochytrium bullatum]|nr:hypothetical protein HDU96_004281 [Phlyctochytrium bullatum]